MGSHPRYQHFPFHISQINYRNQNSRIKVAPSFTSAEEKITKPEMSYGAKRNIKENERRWFYSNFRQF